MYLESVVDVRGGAATSSSLAAAALTAASPALALRHMRLALARSQPLRPVVGPAQLGRKQFRRTAHHLAHVRRRRVARARAARARAASASDAQVRHPPEQVGRLVGADGAVGVAVEDAGRDAAHRKSVELAGEPVVLAAIAHRAVDGDAAAVARTARHDVDLVRRVDLLDARARDRRPRQARKTAAAATSGFGFGFGCGRRRPEVGAAVVVDAAERVAEAVARVERKSRVGVGDAARRAPLTVDYFRFRSRAPAQFSFRLIVGFRRRRRGHHEDRGEADERRLRPKHVARFV